MSRPNARTIYLLKRAETACRAGMETALADLGVTPSQYTTLSLLSGQAEQSSADLARKAGVTPQSMSETIATLERGGLISRAENPQHRRILTISQTEAGRALLAECQGRIDGVEARLLGGLAADETEALRRALTLIAQNGAER